MRNVLTCIYMILLTLSIVAADKPYTVVLDDDYGVYCPWMVKSEPVGKVWDDALTDAAVEVFESEKDNREQRRKKREKRQKK